MAPTVSNVTGSWGAGNSLTITCTGAGTKSRSKPVIWWGATTNSLNPDASLSTVTTWGGTQGTAKNTTNQRWGSYVLSTEGVNDSNWGSTAWNFTQHFNQPGTPANGDKLVLSCWRKMTCTGVTGRNLKPWRIWSGGSLGGGPPNINLSSDQWGVVNHDPLWYTENETPVTHTNRSYVGGMVPVYNGSWHYDEVLIQRNSSAGSADGKLIHALDGTTLANEAAFQFNYADETGIINYVVFQDVFTGSTNPNGNIYKDSLYCDDSWNRVKIGNASTLAACTAFEAQPYTSWSDTSVVINLIPGTLSQGSSWLYLFDNNNAASSGFALSGLSGGSISVISVSPNSGPAAGGTSITITGSNFVATPTVKVGGTSATGVGFTNSTTVTATTPAHAAGSGDVLVTNPDTTNATLVSGFTFVAAPTFTSITPNSGTTLGGTDFSITGTGFSATPTISIGGVACTNVAFTNSTTITGTTPAGSAGAANVLITNPDGQTVTGTGAYTFNVVGATTGHRRKPLFGIG